MIGVGGGGDWCYGGGVVVIGVGGGDVAVVIDVSCGSVVTGGQW